ncbi:MAG: phytanoyl-CoA dioxygenase family protein, partial [Gemmatimonadetes bacterium]|nr:phytanoyl-CoA dioxygenase family protein [Gemmatimonadota bacterium]
MDRESMTNEENYFFDTEGYIIVPGALTSKEVDTLNNTLDDAGPSDNLLTLSAPLRDPFRDLLVHPVLVWYLNQICGSGFRLDRAPRLIGEATGDDPNAPLQGNNEPRDTARAYYFQNNYHVCHGVRVIWALCDVNADNGGVVLVPASHKSNVEAPEDLLTGADDMDLIEQPVLKAGDLLIIGGTTLQGLRPWKGRNPQRLIACEYANRAVLQSNGSGAKIEPRPEWMANLPPEQVAVLSNPGYKDTTD